MPIVIAQGNRMLCPYGSNLRQILLQHGIRVHNDAARVINCRGLGTCGTCAVLVEGDVSAPTWRDRARLSLPPHSPSRNLRLACQTQVQGTVHVTKFDGFWGEGTNPVWTPTAKEGQSL
jgi:ferredoxin